MHAVAKAILTALTTIALVAGAAAAPAAAEGLDWPPEPSTSGADQCGDILFIGVRGSGEDWPYGPTVQRVRDQLVQRTAEVAGDRGRARVREIALDFPATSPYSLTDIGAEALLFDDQIPDNDYLRSVDAGRAELHRILDDAEARCPNERWVLVGFSQGAQVITETLAERGDAPQLAGALLFGNPLHYPSQQVHEFGTGPESATGLVAAVHYLRETAQVARDPSDEIGLKAVIRTTLAMSEGEIAMPRMQRVARYHRMEIPAVLADRVVSVCDTGDIICDAGSALARVMLGASTISSETDRARPIHQGYGEEVIAAASTALVDELLADLPPVEKPAEELPEAEGGAELPVELIGAGAGAGLLLVAGAGLALRRRRRGDGDDDDTDWHLLSEDVDEQAKDRQLSA